MTQVLKAIAVLMDYPTQDVIDHQAELLAVIDQDDTLSVESKQALFAFMEEHCSMDLLDWQSDYDALFERGRNLSLLLFEHVHGESRDRGQAMVDLIEQYKAAGLEIGVNELPDYIPLFLEFVASQDIQNAQAWLMDVSHILALLLTRLEERDDSYASLFSALVEYSKAEINFGELQETVAKEERDDTNEAIDKVWEEESVTFGGDAVMGGCPSSVNKPTEAQSKVHNMPVKIMEPSLDASAHQASAANQH